MKRFLIDVNVLIALFDTAHEHHEECTKWAEKIKFQIVISPIVENGLIRICTHDRYPNGASTYSECIAFLRSIRSLKNPKFMGSSFFFSAEVKSNFEKLHIPSKYITDIYLLYLAKNEDSYFATFDKKIPKSLVNGCEDTLFVLST